MWHVSNHYRTNSTEFSVKNWPHRVDFVRPKRIKHRGLEVFLVTPGYVGVDRGIRDHAWMHINCDHYELQPWGLNLDGMPVFQPPQDWTWNYLARLSSSKLAASWESTRLWDLAGSQQSFPKFARSFYMPQPPRYTCALLWYGGMQSKYRGLKARVYRYQGMDTRWTRSKPLHLRWVGFFEPVKSDDDQTG